VLQFDTLEGARRGPNAEGARQGEGRVSDRWRCSQRIAGKRDGPDLVRCWSWTSQTVALAHLRVGTHLARHTSKIDEAAGHQVYASAHAGKLAGPLMRTNTATLATSFKAATGSTHPGRHTVRRPL